MKKETMSRAEAYNAIKARGLQGECVKRFGKNFTMCKTQDLIDLLGEGSSKPAPVKKKKEVVVEEKATKEVEISKESSIPEGNVAGALEVLLEGLYGSDTIEEATYNRAMAELKGTDYKEPEKMSRSEINKMFDFVH